MQTHINVFLLISMLATYALCYENENEIDGYYSAREMRGRCVSDYDCKKGECSVMGFQRYSEPKCEPLGGLGAPCRHGPEAENKTLWFPNMVLECENVYMQFCPCAKGLECIEAECRLPRKQPRKAVNRRYNSWARMRNLHTLNP